MANLAKMAKMANISGAERGAIFASVPTRVSARLPGGCRPGTRSGTTRVIPRGVGKSRRRRVGPAQPRAPEVAMLIPYDPLEHLRDPDMRCKDLVSRRGAKISIEILKGACLSGEMPSRGHHQVVEPVVAHGRSPSRLEDGRLGSGKALPRPRKKWFRQPEITRVIWNRVLTRSSGKQRSWFRVWALSKPVAKVPRRSHSLG